MGTSAPRARADELALSRDAFGRLLFAPTAAGAAVVVTPVRAFPLGAPGECLALVGPHGEELAWIDRLDEQPERARSLIEEELAGREFMPEIRAILSVSGYSTPSTWLVETDRGRTELVLRGEEYIRRLSAGALLVTDLYGIQFLVRNLATLDRQSRQILDRFL